jgi:HAD superfamily hydrolase (TIGR01549 family)
METAMMTSTFHQLKDAFDAVGNEFGVRIYPKQMDLLVGMWNKSWMLAKPYSETEEALKELSQEYKLYIVSNTDCFAADKVLKKYGLDQYFNRVFWSYDVGLIKTNPQMFKQVLQELELSPEEVVMVGDSIESDMLPAQNAGIKTLLIDRKNSREYPNKIASLTEIKSKIEE